MKPEDGRWLGAAIDFEGTITVSTRNSPRNRTPKQFVITVHITNTREKLIDEIIRVTGIERKYVYAPRAHQRKTVYHWSVSSRMAGEVLKAVFPFLIAKRRQALIALRLQEIASSNKARNALTDRDYRIRHALAKALSRANGGSS